MTAAFIIARRSVTTDRLGDQSSAGGQFRHTNGRRLVKQPFGLVIIIVIILCTTSDCTCTGALVLSMNRDIARESQLVVIVTDPQLNRSYWRAAERLPTDVNKTVRALVCANERIATHTTKFRR